MSFEIIVDFIIKHWEFFSSILISLFGFLFLLLKKKVKVIDSIDIIVQKLVIDLLIVAENKFGSGHGTDKKNFVFNGCLNYIRDNFPGVDPVKYSRLIDTSIEKILSTPQKKGD